MAKYLFTGKEYASKAINIAKNLKTLYVTGGWGAPATNENKQRYIKGYSQNQEEPRRTDIMNASSDTFFFDCICLVKAIFWGFDGDVNEPNGGSVYESNGVPDCTTEKMLDYCTDVTNDFNNIKVGEYLWMQGHAGIYVGDGLAVECTPKWENKVQITAVHNIGKKSGYNGRKWTKHGKFQWIDYTEVAPIPVDVQKYAINEVVYFNGTKHYPNEGNCDYKITTQSVARVTKYSKGAKHPYHLRHCDKNGVYLSGGVYGWVNESDMWKVAFSKPIQNKLDE